MKAHIHQILIVLEVFLVRFVGVTFMTLGIYRIFPGFETWQVETLGFPFPVFGDVVMMGLAPMAILVLGKSPARYGLLFKNLKYHLDITAKCFIPVVLANIPFGLGIDHTTWGGALILVAAQIALLLFLAHLLKRQPSVSEIGLPVASLFLVSGLAQHASPTVSKVIVVFLTYAFFVGFGEEILYRGYMQSRLNESFGKPFRFFGVDYGWGAIITAMLFGLSHAGVVGWLLGLSDSVTLAWGFWTFFGGLVFGFVREKTGSILAPALLHGLPQALAAAVMVLF